VVDLHASGAALLAAGMKLIAISQSSFAFYQGVDGVVIELVDRSLVPAGSGVNTPQPSLISLGVPSHMDIYACEEDALQAQMSRAFGLTWQPPEVVTNVPFEFADGSTQYANVTFLSTERRRPGVELEVINPHPFPFDCGAQSSTLRPAYSAPTGRTLEVKEQLESAGLTMAAASILNEEPLVAVYVGTNGYTIEVVDAALDF
jgi:hypothetical protein